MDTSCATVCIIFVQVRCIRMDFQYHTTGIERDDCLLLGYGIIEEFFDPFHCVFGGEILFRGNGALGWDHCAVDCPCVEM